MPPSELLAPPLAVVSLPPEESVVSLPPGEACSSQPVATKSVHEGLFPMESPQTPFAVPSQHTCMMPEDMSVPDGTVPAGHVPSELSQHLAFVSTSVTARSAIFSFMVDCLFGKAPIEDWEGYGDELGRTRL